MNYSEQEKRSILEEGRATAKRRLSDRRAEPSPIEFVDPVTKWREEMSALELARAAEKERMSFVQSLYRGTQKMQRDISTGLNAVNQLAEKITERLEDLSAEVEELRTKLKIADARFDDLKKSVDARGAEIVELPNPLMKRVK